MKYAIFVKHKAGYGVKYLEANSAEEARASVQQSIDTGEVHNKERLLRLVYGPTTFEIAGVLPFSPDMAGWDARQVERALAAAKEGQ